MRKLFSQLLFACALLASPSSRAAAPVMTKEDLDAFVSGIMQTQLERNDIAGAVVTVVKDGEVLFAKGYGYADVKSHTPVTVDGTLFRIGSISKLLTWTAVMQQVEQGKIDLDADVNQYLDFHIPDAFGKPVTMRALMTHSAGFEERIQGLIVATPAQIGSLQRYLASHIPARIFAPGTVGAYSNYGAALAGYIVQRVSGEEFSSYIQRHITAPLKMRHTTFGQPLPASLAPLMSSGYELASQPARPYELVPAAPAGSVAASASDMARFMIAQLQKGALDGATILLPDTATRMQSRQFAFDQRDNAMCFGFYEESRNGQRIIGHGGDSMYFHSDLHLLPEANIGFFVSYNSAGNSTLSGRGPLFSKFMNRYFPVSVKAPQAIASAKADAQEIAHNYLSSRRAESNMGYAPFVFGHTMVSAEPDGTITVEDMNGPDAKPLHWVETAPGYWEDNSGLQRHLTFKRGDDGRWQFSAGYPFMQFQQAGGLQNGMLNTIVFTVAIAVFAFTLLLWPVANRVRKHFGAVRPGKREQRARIAVRSISALQTLYFGGGLLYLTSNGPTGITQPGFDSGLAIVMAAGWIAAFSTLPGLWFALDAWRSKGLWWWTRTHRSLIAIAGLVLTVFGLYSHLLSSHIAY